MDPNQNPPSEREWTEQEKEEFFNGVDAVTGLSGMPTNAQPFRPSPYAHNCGDELAKEWGQTLLEPCETPGIYVTRVGAPESGWLIGFYCPICRKTEFLLSPWAIRPEKGDFWMMQMCGDEVLAFKHNMESGMKGYRAPIELKPGILLR